MCSPGALETQCFGVLEEITLVKKIIFYIPTVFITEFGTLIENNSIYVL